MVGGLSALAAGLVSQGIPKQSAIKYDEEIKADKFVLVVHGTTQEAERAHAILSTTAPVRLEKHPATGSILIQSCNGLQFFRDEQLGQRHVA